MVYQNCCMIVEPELRTIVAPMAERTMEELLRAPTEGYGEAIILPEINADHFEIKTNLNVPNDVIKLMMFPYSPEGAAKTWYGKEPPNSILTWEDLVTKSVNQFLPSLRNDSPKRTKPQLRGPSILTNPSPKKVVERETEETMDKEQSNFQGSTAQIPPPVIPISIPKPDVPKTFPKTTPIPKSDVLKSLPKPNIPYPSRLNQEKSRDKASKFRECFTFDAKICSYD
ncbi:hypothetical protein Tco_0839013 [Tanacetum coccineum]|uniref:Reverse transcriptase domain-containing protein n=1 Tax=Tanacetum coccineum TaxID=301880 RepID=A0ABQ5APG6_9ASTR